MTRGEASIEDHGVGACEQRGLVFQLEETPIDLGAMEGVAEQIERDDGQLHGALIQSGTTSHVKDGGGGLDTGHP